MKRFKIIGLCLVAAFAFSAVVASASVAALPEWHGPFPKPFTSLSGPGTLETAGAMKNKIKCASDGNVGEITAAKAGVVLVTFLGCKQGINPCRNEGTENIMTEKLKMTLGYINETTKLVGVALEPEAGKKEPLAKFHCDIDGVEAIVEVKGSVIGDITPVNTLTDLYTLSFVQSKGVQAVQNLVGGKKDTLEASLFEGPLQEAGEGA